MATTWRNQPLLFRIVFPRLQISLLELRRCAQTLATEGEGTNDCRLKDSQSDSGLDCFNMSTWKVVDSRVAGISKASISPSTWKVLNILQSRGFQAYLVGGCVRDLLLKKTPKDFDVITSATLDEVKREFHRVIVVGRQFPICRVYIKGSIVEVSSFETTRKNAKERKTIISPEMASDCDSNSLIRWKNCLQRDFTINSLFYDPSSNTIYDYVDGIKDAMSSKIRTVIPAHLSFEEDCARILRGLRIAARLGLVFSKETAQAIRDFSSSVTTLDKSRLMMEMNSMMAYGAAGPSILLLQKFKLLEILLPIHDAYVSLQMTSESGLLASMLMKLLFCADKFLSADRPSECSLWLGLLAFHLALLLHPQDALVVWTFASILYHGEWKTAVGFARESASARVRFVPELRSHSENEADDLLLEKVSLLASLVKSSIRAFVDANALAALNAKYCGASRSGLVFVSPKMGNTVAEIFSVLTPGVRSHATTERKARGVDYELLKRGNPDEVRLVLGKIIIDAMNSGGVAQGKEEEPADLKAPTSLYSLFRC